MSRMRPILGLSALVIALGPGGLVAAPQDAEPHPGSVDIDWSKALGVKEPSVQVTLGPALLKLMASAGEEADPDVVELVEDLSHVRVIVHEDLPAGGSDVAEAVDAQIEVLLDEGWSPVVKVREGEQETVDILMKADGETIVGFVIFVAEPDELVFVNIAGTMDPETFGPKLGAVVGKVSGGDLELDGLDDLTELLKSSTDDGDTP
ncbi:DUF4252 domain-containing protein [Tautonia plasticadhaerens]|uniref:DUF4252 domain-containing protein n=1 Tax=Tautonia plasticadhaerens TaxID=2527974 RepID=A0A518HE16_9BACT|nr:DUF4252 domain-containing protein [Tautonia plasticadhaerens]QDV39090.1 hypothetical protein ElP_70530 [Tautonia plasticadhaerens]